MNQMMMYGIPFNGIGMVYTDKKSASDLVNILDNQPQCA